MSVVVGSDLGLGKWVPTLRLFSVLGLRVQETTLSNKPAHVWASPTRDPQKTGAGYRTWALKRRIQQIPTSQIPSEEGICREPIQNRTLNSKSHSYTPHNPTPYQESAPKLARLPRTHNISQNPKPNVHMIKKLGSAKCQEFSALDPVPMQLIHHIPQKHVLLEALFLLRLLDETWESKAPTRDLSRD